MMPNRSVVWPPDLVVAVCLATLVVGSMLLLWSGGPASAATTVSVTPAPHDGSYVNGQTIVVSVGANSLFEPNTRVNIVECADPGGTTAGLPTSLTDCDENTVQADTVLVQSNGSFTEHAYALYSLPNALLGERPSWLPVCSQTSQCVLYVGENQDDFTQPKLFSQPFAITPTAGSTPAATPATPAAASTTSPPSPSPSAAVTLPPGQLAFTGSSTSALWLALVGLGLTGAGIYGRRLLGRRSS